MDDPLSAVDGQFCLFVCLYMVYSIRWFILVSYFVLFVLLASLAKAVCVLYASHLVFGVVLTLLLSIVFLVTCVRINLYVCLYVYTYVCM